MDIKKNEDKLNKFYCDKCDYLACDKYNYTRHLSTQKHKKIIIQNEANEAIEKNEANIKVNKNYENIIIKKRMKQYKCICGKKYKHQPNLIRHKKTNCKLKEKVENKIIEKSENETDYKELIMTLINENKEMRKTISELVPKIGNTTNNTTLNTTNNNITNNANFNMNIFLNEQCKDALRLDDFINQIEVSISNLLLTKDKGLIDGISNIFIENMNKLSLYERPVHCTDLKRETLYIKQDEWIKDKDNSIVKDAIKKVSRIQSKNINKWSSQNPDYLTKSEKQSEFIKLVKNTTDDLDGKQDKIIKNICKTVYINEKTIKTTEN
jgi:hypothetical protein